MKTIWNDDGTNGPVLICLPPKRECFRDQVVAFCKTIEAQQRERLAAEGMSSLLIGTHYTGKVKMGRKYANVDFGGSGKYMVVLDTGEIFGIKAYGVIHRGHYYGTLDTIADWDWSGYSATRRKVAA